MAGFGGGAWYVVERIERLFPVKSGHSIEDGMLRVCLKEPASERRRFGDRRLHILLKREGRYVNRQKLYPLCREEDLTVGKRGGRKCAIGRRRPMAPPNRPDQRWSPDFMSDCLEDGRRFLVLSVIDDFSRECLTSVAEHPPLPGECVVPELDRVAEMRCYPKLIISD